PVRVAADLTVEQAALVGAESRAGADVVRSQRLKYGDEGVVPNSLELLHRATGGLHLGLTLDRDEQFLGQLGNLGQVRPRPLEGRPELGNEVLKSTFPSRDAVGQERSHQRPAQ